MKRVFERKAVAINAFLRKKERQPVTIARLEQVFRAGFEEGLGAALAASGLTAYETELADRLAKEKYAADGWEFAPVTRRSRQAAASADSPVFRADNLVLTAATASRQ